MLYRHKTTGEEREFVVGMTVAPEWSRVVTMKHGRGVLSISEVDPKSIDTIKSRKAAATRAKNKSKNKSKSQQKREAATKKDGDK